MRGSIPSCVGFSYLLSPSMSCITGSGFKVGSATIEAMLNLLDPACQGALAAQNADELRAEMVRFVGHYGFQNVCALIALEKTGAPTRNIRIENTPKSLVDAVTPEIALSD